MVRCLQLWYHTKLFMASLFQPLKIRDIELKNRIIVSPMCQYSGKDGFANDWHLVHLGSRAVGGAAVVFTEACSVSPEGRITHSDLGIWKNEHIPFLKRITTFIEDQGSIAGIQLAHAGRKASRHAPWEGGAFLTIEEGAWTTLAPSAIPFKDNEPHPSAITELEIQQLIADFKKAAERALLAGFKIVEIHAAHGYLLHEFLSPLSNKRTDQYGGSLENRMRLLVEICKEVREVCTDGLPLFVRISATDWVQDGWKAEDSVILAKTLLNVGVDLIDCSTGGNVSSIQIPVGPLYQVPYAEKIKKEAGILTGAVGMINTTKEAEQIISEQQADVVLLARQFLRDPYFPLHAAKESGIEVDWPVQYERAKK